MKKSILYIMGLALAFGITSCNSDDPADATEKHVYAEGEMPYLRANPAATNTIAHSFLAARIDEPLVINLKDYASSFHKNLNMTVDETLTAMANGEVKFYTINTGRQRWNLDEPTFGTSGWYYGTANMPVTAEEGVFSMELDSKAKTITVHAVNEPAVGSMTTMDFGFALANGKDYDDYVRFLVSCSVSDPSTVIIDATIPEGGYNVYGINLKDYAEAIELCMGMSFADFVTAMDEKGEIDVYLCDADGNWVLDADGNHPEYTSGWLGYWLDENLNITYWDGGGYPANLMFLENGGGGTYNLGNSASSTPAGTQARVRFDLVANGDPATAVHFIINVTFG